MSAILTALFLLLDKLCPCCCDCFLQPRKEISVYNPKLNKRFISSNGKVTEEDDITKVKEAVEIEMVIPTDNKMNLKKEEAETDTTCPRSKSPKFKRVRRSQNKKKQTKTTLQNPPPKCDVPLLSNVLASADGAGA